MVFLVAGREKDCGIQEQRKSQETEILIPVAHVLPSIRGAFGWGLDSDYG